MVLAPGGVGLDVGDDGIGGSDDENKVIGVDGSGGGFGKAMRSLNDHDDDECWGDAEEEEEEEQEGHHEDHDCDGGGVDDDGQLYHNRSVEGDDIMPSGAAPSAVENNGTRSGLFFMEGVEGGVSRAGAASCDVVGAMASSPSLPLPHSRSRRPVGELERDLEGAVVDRGGKRARA